MSLNTGLVASVCREGGSGNFLQNVPQRRREGCWSLLHPQSSHPQGPCLYDAKAVTAAYTASVPLLESLSHFWLLDRILKQHNFSKSVEVNSQAAIKSFSFVMAKSVSVTRFPAALVERLLF